MPISSLPVELLDKIMRDAAELSTDETEPFLRHITLRSCSLVHSYWRYLAQDILFEHPTVGRLPSLFGFSAALRRQLGRIRRVKSFILLPHGGNERPIDERVFELMEGGLGSLKTVAFLYANVSSTLA